MSAAICSSESGYVHRFSALTQHAASQRSDAATSEASPPAPATTPQPCQVFCEKCCYLKSSPVRSHPSCPSVQLAAERPLATMAVVVGIRAEAMASPAPAATLLSTVLTRCDSAAQCCQTQRATPAKNHTCVATTQTSTYYVDM